MKADMPALLGINKSPSSASFCVISGPDRENCEIHLQERFSRIKSSGDSMLSGLDRVDRRSKFEIAENCCLVDCRTRETWLSRRLPFRSVIRAKKRERFSTLLHPENEFLTHHYCHAVSALAISPFSMAMIVVFDAEGNYGGVFGPDHPERALLPAGSPAGGGRRPFESFSVYLMDGARLRCIRKDWSVTRRIGRGRFHYEGAGLGSLFEEASKYIFNSLHESGKVMGLAPFGNPRKIVDRDRFINSLDWKRAFRGCGKEEWQNSGRFSEYADLAAAVQRHFSEELLRSLAALRKQNPEYENLILSGGCALNCVANSLIQEKRIFRNVFVPPFPGDEGISFGAAQHLRLVREKRIWKKTPIPEQPLGYGPLASVPSPAEIRRAFRRFSVTWSPDPPKLAARHLAQGGIIGWFQGRSESGPRALGRRSLLADPRIPNLKDRLNRRIKFREDFRPYGGSCLQEKASAFFEVPADFESPFMSFAPRLRKPYAKRLASIGHIDGTSRIQTVGKMQDPAFYDLIREFGDLTGLPCVLNTSMNVMREPLVETVQDAAKFFSKSEIRTMFVGDYVVSKDDGLTAQVTYKSWPSVKMLQKRCGAFFHSRFGTKPLILDHSAGPHAPRSREGVHDVVLLGDFIYSLSAPPRDFVRRLTAGRVRLWFVGSGARLAASRIFSIPLRNLGLVPRSALFPRARGARPALRRGAPEALTLVYAGRLTESKNIRLMLEVVHALQETCGLDIGFKLYGDWDWLGRSESGKRYEPFFREKIMAWVSERKWKRRPEFMGRSSTTGWLRQKSVRPVFFSLSDYMLDDFGVSAAQASQAGWPSILSAWGGHLDVAGAVNIPYRLVRAHAAVKIAELIARDCARLRRDGAAKRPATEPSVPVPISTREFAGFPSAFIEKHGFPGSLMDAETVSEHARKPRVSRVLELMRTAFSTPPK